MKLPIARRIAFPASAVLMALAGCADLNDTGLAALSYKVQAYAIVDEQLVQGDMVLFPDHTGTITLRADASPSGAGAGVASVPRAYPVRSMVWANTV